MYKIVLRERSKKDVDRSVEEIMRKVKNEKERNLRCYYIASQYYKVGDYESARNYVCMYLSTKEDSPMGHKLLGQALEGLGQKEKAISEYKRSLELENNQPDLVLKICQLISENEVHFDHERARYWCERGQDMFPHDPAIFRLKERLLCGQNGNAGIHNMKAFEDLINSELKALPNNVNARIRLLKLYVDTGRTQMAYNHVLDLESKQTFRFELTWYEYLSELYQTYYDEFTSQAKGDWEFFINWISALERLVALILAETSNSAPRSLAECSSAVLRLDQILHQANLIPSPTSKLFEEFLKHMSAQFCLHLATYIFKKAKKEQNNWKETSKNVQPLLLLALISAPDTEAPFTVSLRDGHKKLLKLWNESGSYRICQAGNILLSLSKESGQQFIEKIILSCNINWRERLYQRIFGKWEHKDAESKSHFIKYTGYNNLPRLMIPTSQLRSPNYIKACEKIHPGSLHHITWIGLQTMRHSSPRPPQMLPPPEFHTYGFSELQYTVHNLQAVGVESLNRLDLDSFLYATVLCAGAQLDDQIRSGFYAVDRPITLPADITAQLCSTEQAKWWNAAYKIYKKQAGDNWGDLRMVLSRGIEVIRAVGNHGLDILLMIQLARTFAERAICCSNAGKGSPGYSEVPALEARANLYWRAVIPLLERMEQKQALKVPPTNRLFEYQSRHIEPSEIKSFLEEGRLFTAVQLMKDEAYEEAIEAFKSLRSPYASFHSAAIYKRLAQAEISNCRSEEVTSEMRSKHVILLTKARDSLHLTKEKIHDDRQHPLHLVLGSQISDVESLLSRIELDGAPADDRSEGVALSEPSFSPPGSVISHGESAGGDYNINSALHHELNGQHMGHYPGNVIASTPKSQHTRAVHHSSHRQQRSRNIFSTSTEAAAPFDIEKVLVNHEGAIIKRIELLLEDHRRKIIEEVNGKLEVAIDEIRRDMNRLRPEDLYMLGDEEDYTEDVLGFPTAYQAPPTNQTVPPTHVVTPTAPFYAAPAPVARGAQGTSTVTYGAPPQPPAPQFFPPFQPSPQPPIQPHQLGFYGQGALPFSEGQLLPDFLRPGLNLSKAQPNVVITTSDSLPTGPPPVQPTLSVTIPPKHRMGTIPPQPQQPAATNAPHEFQITMPPSAQIPDLQKSPVAMAAVQDDLESDEGTTEVEHDPFPDFKPIIPLPDEVVVTTGEEGEKVLFENRAKLFRFVEREWKERGIGSLKILQNLTTGKVRLLMRREQVHKICANHYLTPEMKLTPMVDSDRAWVWLAQDFADEKLQTEKLCAKFKTSDDAARFKDAFDSAKILTANNVAQQNVKTPQQLQQIQKDKSTAVQTSQPQSSKIEVGGFTFTSQPILKPSQDVDKEKEKKEPKVVSTAAPSPFATFSFNFTQNNANQKSAFLIPTTTSSQFVSPSTESVSSIFKSPAFSSPASVNVPKTDAISGGVGSPASSSSVLKPPVLTPPSSIIPPVVSPTFVKTTMPSAEVKSIFQSPASIFSPSTEQQKDIQQSTNRDILKTPIFSTPTGPNLILNQLNITNQITSSSALSTSPNTMTTTQPKHVLFKDTVESMQKPTNKPVTQQNVSPKSILKETLASEPLSSSSVISKPKHVLFQETTTKDKEKPTSTTGEVITLRRPHLPLQKLLSSGETTVFDKAQNQTIDFAALAKQAGSESNGFKKNDDFKGFEGAGTTVFKTVSTTKKDDNEEEGDDGEDFVPSAEFKPVVPLPELITVETGEEGQTLLYEQRAKLLRYDNETKQWKERGVGKMKVLFDPKTSSARLLMRREQVFKVCCNHRITPELQLKLSFNSDKAWTWYAQDYSEGVVTNEFFALRFKTTDQAMEFKNVVEKAKEMIVTSCDLNLSDVSNVSFPTKSDTSYNSNKSDTSASSYTVNSSNPQDDDSNIWKCSICLFPNADAEDECRACQNSKCDDAPLSQLNRFKRHEATWECPECYVINDLSSNVCMACYTTRSTKIEEIPSAPVNPPVTQISQPSLTELFKPKAGSWECSGCFVRNNAEVKCCVACGTMKEGETAPATSGTIASSLSGNTISSGGGFKFSNTDFTKSGFTFGMPKQSSEMPSGVTFSFGVMSGSSNNNSNQVKKDESSDSVTKPVASTGFMFGVPSTSSNDSKKGEGLATTFTKPIFGSFGSTPPKSSPSATFTFGDQSAQKPTAFVFKGPDTKDQSESDQRVEFNFSGVRRPRTLSGSSASGSAGVHPDSGPDSEGEVNEEEEEGDGIFFQPVIPLPDKVPVTTGEEDEEVLYSHRAKLFRFVDGEWKERGIGDVKILKHQQNKKIRLLMRRETVLKICLNHFLTAELSFQPKDDKTWLWCAMDYSEGEFSQEKFAIRFKTPDIAKDFKDAIDAAQVELSSDSSSQTSVPEKTVTSIAATTSTEQNISSAMKNFSFTLPGNASPATPSSGSGFSLASHFGGNSGDAGSKKSLFGGSEPKPSDTSTKSNKDEGDVEVVYEKNVSEDLREKALKLQLPPNFYLYLNAPSCPGCEGCEPEDRMSNNNASTSTVNTITKSPNMITSPSVSSNSTSISSTRSSAKEKSSNENEQDDQRLSKTDVSVTNMKISSDNNTAEDLSTKSNNTTAVQSKTCDSTSQDADDKCSFLFKKDALSFSDIASSNNSGFREAPSNFQWAGANAMVFGSLQKSVQSPTRQGESGKGDSSGGEDEEGGEVAANVNEPHFEPIIPLPPLVALSTGEEEEQRVFCERAKLFIHHPDTKEWKERGVGEIKILHHPVKLMYRLLMRREQVHKIVCNHLISPELSLAPLSSSNKAWCWSAMNLAEEYTQPKLESLAIRFKNEEIAKTFYEKVAECIKHIREIKKSQAQQFVNELSAQHNANPDDHGNENDDNEEDYEDDDDSDPDEDSEDIDDDEDDDDGEWEIIFEKKVTISVRDTKQMHWSSVGSGTLLMHSNAAGVSGQIKIFTDRDSALFSCTTIDENTNEIEVSNRTAVWTANDTALDPPTVRQIMAMFQSESDAHVFHLSFQEILSFTKYDAYQAREIENNVN